MNQLNTYTHYQVIEADLNGINDLSISVETGEVSYTFDMLNIPNVTAELEKPKAVSMALGCHDKEIPLYHPDTLSIAVEIFPRWFRPACGVLAVILDNKLMGKNITSLKDIMEKTGYKEASVRAATNTLQVYLKGSGWEIFGRMGNWTIAKDETSKQ